jgi:kinetochore protein Spc7/SPC105
MSMELEESTDSEEGEDSEDDQVHVQQSIYPQLPTHAAEVEAESDDDGEMSMEETQVFNPQDLQHEGEGDESMISESEANTSRSDMSMTMDFTVAIGGLLPQAPPAGAQRGRQSVGYNHVDPENGEPLIPGEGEDDMEMDETTVFGGIINITTASRMDPDDTISTASGSEDTMNMSHRSRDPTLTFSHNSLHDLDSAAREERSVMGIDTTEGMDVTTATGGIFSQSYQRPQQVHSHTLSQSQSQSQTQTQVQVQVQMQMASSTPKSPRVTSITQPMGGTPSFARATASSASKAKSRSPQKEKRNIFGPSPSPFKGHSTPRKSGMQTAGEVAKRLSFGSATSGSSSSSKKRTVDTFTVEQEEKENQTYEQPSSAKKQRLSAPTALGLGESVFGSASAGAIVLGSKAASPVAKLMAQSPRVSSPARAVLESTTPSRSPAIRRAMGVADTPIDDAEEDEDEGEGSKEEPRTIGMRAFLDMAGVQFDDSAPSVLRRRSSAARGLLGQDPSESTPV